MHCRYYYKVQVLAKVWPAKNPRLENRKSELQSPTVPSRNESDKFPERQKSMGSGKNAAGSKRIVRSPANKFGHMQKKARQNRPAVKTRSSGDKLGKRKKGQ